MISVQEINLIKGALNGIAYEKLILFGSRARNDHRSDSDYDLMIVLSGKLTRSEKMRISTDVTKRLAVLGLDCDILVRSAEEIAYLKDRIGNTVRYAMKEGISID